MRLNHHKYSLLMPETQIRTLLNPHLLFMKKRDDKINNRIES